MFKYAIGLSVLANNHLQLSPIDIGADIMDSTNKHSMYTYGQLNEKNTYFRLNDAQQVRWDKMKQFNGYFREQHHNLHQLVWRPYALHKPIVNDQPSLVGYEDNQQRPDSCRLHGTLTVNKVSGNFHVSAGKYLPLPIGHAHISLIGDERGNEDKF